MVKTPQQVTVPRGAIIGNQNNQTNSTPNFPFSLSTNNHNRRQLEMYEQDRSNVERMNAQKMAEENSIASSEIHYNLPSWAGTQGTEHYYQTAKTLLNMLNGKTPLNLKEAVFAVENAFFEGMLDRGSYDKNIAQLTTIARLKAIQDGYNWKNPETKNIMLFRVMSDTLRVKFPMEESYSTSYPMQYDFEDFQGEEDYSKLFVTKLLSSHKGQCHSLPLLYLILCEEVGTEANLAFSPQHSYIKFKDSRNNWHNLELTRGRMVTDAFIMGSGFISAAAIKYRIYMEPQSKEQLIAYCLSDLASGYVHKYGYDDFVAHCVDSVLSYAPGNTSALAMKSNYHSIFLEHAANQVGRPPIDTLKSEYPQIYALLEERDKIYRRMDEIGYSIMPKEVYEGWLNSVNEEKERREHDIRYRNIIRLIK